MMILLYEDYFLPDIHVISSSKIECLKEFLLLYSYYHFVISALLFSVVTNSKFINPEY